jgi:hypothetical protein
MNALAFVSGIHAWPYRREYWRAGKKITDRVTSAYKLTRTYHSPFNYNIAFAARTGSANWDFRDVIRKAADFFENGSALSKEIAIILFLFREADEGVHSEITTITLCALFENLVRLLFKKINAEINVDAKGVKQFEKAKVEVSEQIKLQISENDEGYRRLYNILQSAQAFSIEQMFRAVVNYFNLKWEDDMEKFFKTWKGARNPLIHGKLRSDISEDDQKASAINESQIAGAINILLLKLIGYTGPMRYSTFEDGYRQI